MAGSNNPYAKRVTPKETAAAADRATASSNNLESVCWRNTRWMENGDDPGDKLVNNFKLFTPFFQMTDLCTFTRRVEELYKHCIQNPKALIKKNKRHLHTIVAMLYLLQLLLSFNFQNLLTEGQPPST